MNILLKTKAVFAIVTGVAVGAVLPTALAPHQAPVAPVQETAVATPTQMAVVKVTARRLSAVEKMRSLDAERALAWGASVPRG